MIDFAKKKFSHVIALTVFVGACVHAQDSAVTAAPVSEQKPIVVIVPSYNNEQWYCQNLDSVFMQKYDNYRVIYIDDCSKDKTYELVKQYVEEKGQSSRWTIIRNEKNRGALANLYSAIHSCDDAVIIVTIDGDDWLKHDQVLARVNQAYANPNVLLTYGQYEEYPLGKIGQCAQIRAGVIVYNAYREFEWVTSHLRTFYAGLFKKIALKDLLYEGNFFSVTWDLAMMLPMLEMAAGRIMFIPDVLYVYNQSNPLNDFKMKLVLQIHCDKLIRSMPKYSPLKHSPLIPRTTSKPTAELIAFSWDKPAQLLALLEMVADYCKGLLNVTIIYGASDAIQEQAYDLVQQRWPAVHFVPVTLHDKQAFKAAVMQCLTQSCADYVLFAHDDVVITAPIDIDYCMKMMAQTHAYGFYLALGKNIISSKRLTREQAVPLAVWLEGDVYAWPFKCGEHDWRRPHTLTMALYRKEQLVPVLNDFHVATPASLEMAWKEANIDLDNVGLFFKTSKAAVIDDEQPSMSLRDMTNMVNAGLKLDKRTIPINNKTIDMSYKPIFVLR